jgi:hypothetical protein
MVMVGWRGVERVLYRGLEKSYCAAGHLEEGTRLHRSIGKLLAPRPNQPSDYEASKLVLPRSERNVEEHARS